MSYRSGASLSSSSSVRTPAMPLPTITSFSFLSMMSLVLLAGRPSGVGRFDDGGGLGPRRRLARRRIAVAPVQEIDHRGAAGQVIAIAGQRDAVARPGQGHGQDLADGGRRAVGQHD